MLDNQPELKIVVEDAIPDNSLPLTSVQDLLGDLEKDAARRYEAKQSGKLLGPITGFPELDRKLGGCLFPGLHFFTGAPAIGKTALVLQIAATCGFPALFVSCETSPIGLAKRLAARVTGKFLGRFYTGELSVDESKALFAQAAAEVPHLIIADGQRSYADPVRIRKAAMALLAPSDHRLIVVDSLHTWVRSACSQVPEYDGLNQGIQALGSLAADLDCPILCVAERNRAGISTGGLGSGAGTRMIEYAGESQIDLDPSADVAADWGGRALVAVRLSKNRHGEGGPSQSLWFSGPKQEYVEKGGKQE